MNSIGLSDSSNVLETKPKGQLSYLQVRYLQYFRRVPRTTNAMCARNFRKDLITSNKIIQDLIDIGRLKIENESFVVIKKL